VKLVAERIGRRAVEPDQQFGRLTGPLDRHGTGPYCWTSRALRFFS
jgi:hypothetical protein